MKLYGYIRQLVVETLATLPPLLKGRMVVSDRSLYWCDGLEYNKVPKFSDIEGYLNKQISVNSNTVLSSSYNLCTILIAGTCTLTIPNDIAAPLKITGYVRAGFTLTFAVASGVTLIGNDSVVTVAEKKTFVLEKVNGTNEYLLKIGG